MTSPAIISRKDALRQGLPRYFTGKPCKYGHVAERYVHRKQCIQCRPIHGTRRVWTGREMALVKHYAAERLSINRTAAALVNLHGINITNRKLRGFVHYHKIKFRGRGGAPYGNQNAAGRGKKVQA